MKDNTSIFFAFSSGILSFLSPCVLPLVPAYITYLTGITIEDLKKNKSKVNVIYNALGFTLGFSIIFVLMGISITSVGKLFSESKEIFRRIGGILIVIFGIHTSGIVKVKFLYYEKRAISMQKFTGGMSSILMGMAFAVGWTPCIGPMLASILIYAGSYATLNKGITLLMAYSLGLAIPFIISAFLIDSISSYIKKFSRYFNIVSIISGVVLIVMGIMIFTDKISLLNNVFY